MKVYIVTTGQYSDFQIQAVFSTETAAEAYGRSSGWDKNPYSYWDIDEREVDEEAP